MPLRTLAADFWCSTLAMWARLAAIMTENEAQEVLGSTPLVQVTVAAMNDIKRMRVACLDADIPAMVARPEEGCGSS